MLIGAQLDVNMLIDLVIEIRGESVETDKTGLNAVRHKLQTKRFCPHHARKLINQQQRRDLTGKPIKKNAKQQVKTA